MAVELLMRLSLENLTHVKEPENQFIELNLCSVLFLSDDATIDKVNVLCLVVFQKKRGR